MKKKNVDILLYDIEVSPALGWFYPPTYKTNILEIEQYQTLMSFSWCWYGDLDKDGKPKIHSAALPDYKLRYKADPTDDSELVKLLHEVLDKAQIVIGHNSRKFDDKMANMYFVKHGLGPVSPYKTVDTLSSARGSFRFASNRLDDISKELGMKGKTDIRIGQLWYDCFVKQDKRSWKLLKDYNDQDVVALYNLYEKERPFIRNHPNLSVYLQEQGVCTKCGKSGTLQSRGEGYRVTGVVRQYWCNTKHGGCGGWTYDRIVEDKVAPEDRPDMVNG